ncbi:putative beta-barrel protein YwiB [Fructobacillus sp. EFB-N1]|uniref:DUF1934 domain-containing protein n=1 Tax=Fructobacillus sp. EFB-N1 TaxID=1658766 RepID=UPI00064DB682|nr:DUF1934 domain-containing protein [Fructobacillus sp. EFB-N1]KMK53083.1 putative beta-barrel protein YwiB [Fructobacillus sp. EFB-N1]
MSQKEVQVKISHQVFQDAGDEHYEVETTGLLTIKGDSVYLAYTEKIDDEGETKVIFKLTEKQISLSRHNVTKTRMVFQLGLVEHQPYQTVAGMMLLSTNTNQLDFTFDESKQAGALDLAYALSANDQVVGQYQVALQFGPKSSILY